MLSKMLVASLFAAVSSTGPNFMIFMADDQQFYFDESPPPKYSGRVVPELTGMKRVRDEGAVFLRAYASSVMCAPSRFSVLTGRYASRGDYAIDLTQRQHGNDPVWDGRAAVSVPSTKLEDDDQHRTTARTLQDAGYRTIMSGKWHLNGDWEKDYPGIVSRVKESGFTDPVAVYYENMFEGNQAADGTVYGHNLEWMVESSLDAVQDAVGKSEKFYLYFAPTAPHSPSPYDDMFLDERATPSGLLPRAPVTTMKSRAAIRAAGNDDPDIVSHLWVDEALIAMIDGLESLEVLSTTMIILCMDHGMGAKSQIYEGGARILQAVRYPPLAVPGSVVSSVVSNVDISATIADVAGVTPSYTVEGRSWKSDLQGVPSATTVPKFIELGMDRAVVAGRYKFFSLGVVNTKDKAALGTYPYYNDCIQLYDLVTDGAEQINLAREASYSEVVAQYQSYITCHDDDIDAACRLSEIDNIQLAVANFGNSETQTGSKITSESETCTPLPNSPPSPPPTPPQPSTCSDFTTRRECTAASCSGSACEWDRGTGTCSCPDDNVPVDCTALTTRRSCIAATCPGTSALCVWSNRACSC
eukprot:TRINITY_DN3915_c0_g1_i1.p1 TRINITY_DN3915_c0_g1~~TRINITY_DN3915_c0_g1_i1.p1  ORF type:complete len:607 (+),score=127.87 TRINITY_DN3915_c0_g1_i1:68-1822(+)